MRDQDSLQIIAICALVCLALLAIAFVGGCSEDKERRNERWNHELKKACVLKHGSPELAPDGTFKGCNFSYRGVFKKE